MTERSATGHTRDNSAATAELTRNRLVLRAPRIDDAPGIAAVANNRRIAEQTRRIPHPFSVQDAEQRVGMADHAREPVFVVTLKKGGAIVGAAGCGLMNETDLEVGYWIGEPFWGKGYATEALQAIIDHVFAIRLVDCIYGRCRIANAPSRSVLVKCGFQLVGSGICNSRALNGYVPVEEFALDRSVWESFKRWGEAS